MNQLLKFYIPKVFKQLTINSLILLAVTSLSGILHFSLFEDKEIGRFFLWTLFPIFVFFDSRSYLSSDLNWILLCPLKKRDVLIANVIVNLLKLTLILIVCISVWTLFYMEDGGASDFLKIIGYNELENFHISAYLGTLALMMFWISALVMFVFIPSFSELFKTGDYSSSSGWNVKNIVKVAFPSVVFLAFAYWWDNISAYFPFFIISFIIASITTYYFVIITLETAKIFYNSKNVLVFTICIFIFSTLLIFFLAFSNIQNTKITIDDKLEDLNSLGIFSILMRNKVDSELMGQTENLKSIKRNHFYKYFKDRTDSQLYNELLSKWHRECIDKHNIACRLEAYMIYAKDDYTPIRLLRLGCPTDLRSCLLLTTHDKATKEDYVKSSAVIDSYCKGEGLENRRNEYFSCYYYYRRSKKF